jgi:hypothetical protein
MSSGISINDPDETWTDTPDWQDVVLAAEHDAKVAALEAKCERCIAGSRDLQQMYAAARHEIERLAAELAALKGAAATGHLPDEIFVDEFFAWWESDGQYVRSGGGDYERTFAFEAWRHLYPRIIAAMARDAAGLVRAGQLMSNACYNLAQLRGFESVSQQLDDLRKGWDAALAVHRAGKEVG